MSYYSQNPHPPRYQQQQQQHQQQQHHRNYQDSPRHDNASYQQNYHHNNGSYQYTNSGNSAPNTNYQQQQQQHYNNSGSSRGSGSSTRGNNNNMTYQQQTPYSNHSQHHHQQQQQQQPPMAPYHHQQPQQHQSSPYAPPPPYYQQQQSYGAGNNRQQQQHHHYNHNSNRDSNDYSSSGGSSSGGGRVAGGANHRVQYQRARLAPREQKNKLFIGGTSKETQQEHLEEYFGKFGEIEDAVVMFDQVTKSSKCFGFVTFADGESLDKVMDARPHTINGKEVDVKRAMPKETMRDDISYSSSKVFIGGLSKEVTEEDVIEAVSQFGKIEHVVINKKVDRNRYAFITFADHDHADKMILSEYKTDRKPLVIKGCQVDIKRAIANNSRSKNTMKFNQNMQQGYSDYPYQMNSNYGQ